MAHALRLAARGLGTTWPNPAVGCVIVKDGVILGRGHTQPGGRPHAEQMALGQAGPRAKGATAYVTLEPCAHHGKTPPCAKALIAAGLTRVVTALTDPDPRVWGKGHALLRAAGLQVTEGILTPQATTLNGGFLKRVTQGLPFVTLKLATSLDGRTATASGESRWITGQGSRLAVHTMRLTHDAVMVGSGTALADDPDLTVRGFGSAPHQPVRIVIDSQLLHSPDSHLGRSANTSPVWILHSATAPGQDEWAKTGATLIPCPDQNGHLNLTAALKTLATKGLTRILCEGGATLAAALIRESLIDELAQFTAGMALGAEGHPALGPLGLQTLAAAPRLHLISTQSLGPDTLTRWRVA